jgi:hypothetical protein
MNPLAVVYHARWLQVRARIRSEIITYTHVHRARQDGIALLCDIPLCTPVTEIRYCSGPELEALRVAESTRLGSLGS